MIVGLTGGIGSGKSAAGKYFIELGIDVIDADHVSRNILDKNTKAKDLFIKNFGESFLDKNKTTLVNKNDLSLFKKPIYILGTKDNVEVECSLKWNAGYSEEMLPFANGNISSEYPAFHFSEHSTSTLSFVPKI